MEMLRNHKKVITEATIVLCMFYHILPYRLIRVEDGWGNIPNDPKELTQSGGDSKYATDVWWMKLTSWMFSSRFHSNHSNQSKNRSRVVIQKKCWHMLTKLTHELTFQTSVSTYQAPKKVVSNECRFHLQGPGTETRASIAKKVTSNVSWNE